MKKVWKYLSLTLPAVAAMGIGVIVTIVGMIFFFLITLSQALSGYNKGNMNIKAILSRFLIIREIQLCNNKQGSFNQK